MRHSLSPILSPSPILSANRSPGANYSHHSQSGGFSLIEVLVALSVLALGIAGSAKLSEQGYSHISATQNYNQASYLAHSHLITLGATTSSESLGSAYQRGAYNDRFNWELSLTTIELDPQVSNGFANYQRVVPTRADLTIWFEEDTRSIQFHSLILAPSKPEDPMDLEQRSSETN